jgi:hypothetical protein
MARRSRSRTTFCRILGDVTSQRDTSEDIGADRVDGLLTRRDAMRRLVLVAVTATPTALIAGCSGGRYWPTNRRRRRRRKRRRRP